MIAESIAKALGGRKTGAEWMVRCPANADCTPSLGIRGTDNGQVLVHCHAGCDQDHVIAALRARGLWAERLLRSTVRKPRRTPFEREPDGADVERSKVALAIWQSAKPAPRTLVETYLAWGINLTAPDALRFHPGLKHPSGGLWPAMVALVTSGADGTPIAIHRTYLAFDGGGKAPVAPQKMMLGPCRGGAVRLSKHHDVLMVGDGLEICLAAMLATGRAAWAALSTSGLRGLDLPEDVRDVIVLADGDEAGETAAQECALRWKRRGRRVRLARPPQGMDFNDLLVGRALFGDDRAIGRQP
jgi:hypothetical protein